MPGRSISASTRRRRRPTLRRRRTGPQPSAAPGAPGASIPGAASPPGGPAPSVAGTVAEALAASPRVTIDTPSIGGSIDLKGGKFDDIILKDYRETIDPKSPNIRLFSPPGAPDAYWAETGFVSADGAKTPNLDTVWTADRQTLTAEQPVTLTWDNGAGLTFKRVIAVDDKYMFTIADSVVEFGRRASDGAALSASFCGTAGRTSPDIRCCTRGSWASSPVATRRRWPSRCRFKKSPTPRSKRTTGRVRSFKGDGGWLGFTDKYWGSAVIPDQTAPIEARFSANGTVQPVDYQADFLGKEQTVAPGASFETKTRIFAGAKEVSTIDNYETNLGIKKFSLMIDWGWFWMITHPDVPASGCDLQGRRQFRRRDPHRHRSRQARLLPARQPVLPVDGEDEEDPAEDRGAEGTLSGRSRQAAAGADGAVQARGRQSGRRLPADGDPDPGILRPLQGHLHHHRDAARAVFRLDQGSLVAGSDQRLHPLRARPMGPDRLAGNSAIFSILESGR